MCIKNVISVDDDDDDDDDDDIAVLTVSVGGVAADAAVSCVAWCQFVCFSC